MSGEDRKGRARTVVECATALEVSRALYLGYSASCSEEVARQMGAREYDPDLDAWTEEEIEQAIYRPYGDEEPPPGDEYEHILGPSERSRPNPDPAAPERSPLASARTP